MSNIILYIAASIDSLIADEKGSVDFLDSISHEDDDYGFAKFYDKVDAVIMGRKTYDFCLSGDQWPYEGKQSYVFTNSAMKPDRKDIEFLSGDVMEETNKIFTADFKNIWLVGGGKLNSQFLAHGLIDKIILTIIPVVLGRGIPLFADVQPELAKFDIKAVKEYTSGVVQLTYKRRTN